MAAHHVLRTQFLEKFQMSYITVHSTLRSLSLTWATDGQSTSCLLLQASTQSTPAIPGLAGSEKEICEFHVNLLTWYMYLYIVVLRLPFSRAHITSLHLENATAFRILSNPFVNPPCEPSSSQASRKLPPPWASFSYSHDGPDCFSYPPHGRPVQFRSRSWPESFSGSFSSRSRSLCVWQLQAA